jgi:hypothetical protein
MSHTGEPWHMDQATHLPIEVVATDPPRVDNPSAAAAQAGLATAGHLDLRISVRVEAPTAPLSAGEAAVQARNPGPRTGTGQASRPDQDCDEPTQELSAIQARTSHPGLGQAVRGLGPIDIEPVDVEWRRRPLSAAANYYLAARASMLVPFLPQGD